MFHLSHDCCHQLVADRSHQQRRELCPSSLEHSSSDGTWLLSAAFVHHEHLPKTAKDVLETELGDNILMLASPDLKRYQKGWMKCWNVWFLQSEIGEGLKSLENALMTIEEVASFFECRQIIDPETGLRHSTTIAVNKLEDVRLSSTRLELPRLKNIFVIGDFENKDGKDTKSN